MKNPVIAASGIIGFGLEYHRLGVLDCFGAVVIKGTTLKPRIGNPPPRLAETPAGLLNSVGLENPGVELVVKEMIPRLRETGVTIIVNVAGSTAEEYCAVVERLNDVDGVAALEINVSCPNVEAGGMQFGLNPSGTADLVKSILKVTGRTLIVKLTPNAQNIVPVARAAEDAGAHAVSLINTILGMAIDVRARRPVLSTTYGGLSGPAVKPVALRMVWDVSNAVKIPVIGLGGISTAEDALEFIMAGASAVQVGTAMFTNPRVGREIIAGLEEWMSAEGAGSLKEIVGAAKADRKGG